MENGILDNIKAGAKELQKDIKRDISKLVTLTTTTEITGGENINRKIETTINLLEGDHSIKIDQSFITDEKLKPILDFHLKKEENGLEILQKNIEAVTKIMESLGKFI